jgi:hypothetical protein
MDSLLPVESAWLLNCHVFHLHGELNSGKGVPVDAHFVEQRNAYPVRLQLSTLTMCRHFDFPDDWSMHHSMQDARTIC